MNIALERIETEIRKLISKRSNSDIFLDPENAPRDVDLTEFDIELIPDRNPFYQEIEKFYRDYPYFGRRIKDNVRIIALSKDIIDISYMVGTQFFLGNRSYIIDKLYFSDSRIEIALCMSEKHHVQTKPKKFGRELEPIVIKGDFKGNEINKKIEEYCLSSRAINYSI